MHSPWVSRTLSDLGHEVIVAHARNVRLIGESHRKDDRLDVQTLARLARIDPQLLCPVKHRSAKVSRVAASIVGKRRSVRTVAQQQPSGDTGRSLKQKHSGERKMQSQNAEFR
jgi:hypothetical protein